ncbi:hydrolase [Tenacibaculum sp. KUL152]|nr:hydrolase [Tenacibaculum sp. KUL152]
MNSTTYIASNLSIEQWQQTGQTFPYCEMNIFYQDSKYSELGVETIRPNNLQVAPTVVLIHGFPTASWDWHKIWPSLCLHFRVITLDMLGFGFSDKPSEYDYSIHNQANVFEALLKRLNIRQCHIIAHDYGDSVAQELLYRHTHIHHSDEGLTIQSATLLNGGLFPETHRPKFIQTLLNSPLGFYVAKLISKKSVESNMRSVFGHDTQPSVRELEEMWQLINFNQGKQVFHKLIGYMTQRKYHRERWLEALTHAVCPIQIINGSADPISGEHMVERYETLVSSKNIVRLANVGHYPQMEAPEAVSEAIISFINKQ